MRALIVAFLMVAGVAGCDGTDAPDVLMVGEPPVPHVAAEHYCKRLGGRLADSSQIDEALEVFQEFAAPIWPANSIRNAWLADETIVDGEARYLMIGAGGGTWIAEGSILAYPICAL
jgi:hypothetical protein